MKNITFQFQFYLFLVFVFASDSDRREEPSAYFEYSQKYGNLNRSSTIALNEQTQL